MKKTITLLSAIFLFAGLLATAPLSIAQGDIIPESNPGEDTTPPDDVGGVKAMAGNGSVTLSWNVATDEQGMAAGYNLYYGTVPVQTDGNAYENGPIDVGQNVSYTVQGLTNGVTYYFAITAYDDEGNESINYSSEVSATPMHGAADGQPPKVASATAVDKGTIKVIFSEPVQEDTATRADSYSITEDDSGLPLEVLSVNADPMDETGTSFLLVTASQEEDLNYILTASSSIIDMEGNPIVSGTSDTALFSGSGAEPAADDVDTVEPELTSIEAIDNTTVLVTFSEPVVLSEDPTLSFVITEEDNTDAALTILSAVHNPGDEFVTLTTAPQSDITYFLIALDVRDEAGNAVNPENTAAAFMGTSAGEQPGETPEEVPGENPDETPGEMPEETEDMMAPEDATNFVAKMITETILNLSWAPSLNTEGDLANYILYAKKGDGEFGEGTVLGADFSGFDFEGIVPGIEYMFKLTARDESGNESEGVLVNFVLPETGPEIALLALGSLGIGRLLRRKKSKK